MIIISIGNALLTRTLSMTLRLPGFQVALKFLKNPNFFLGLPKIPKKTL